MADFTKVLRAAQDGYGHRKDYPPFALASWDDRVRWTAYLQTINAEFEAVEKGEQDG